MSSLIGVGEMINDIEARVFDEVANAPVFCFFIVVFGFIVTLLDSVKGVVVVPLLVDVCDVVFCGDNVVVGGDLICGDVVVGIGGGNVVVIFVVGSVGDVVVSGLLFAVVSIIVGSTVVLVVLVGSFDVVVVVVVGGGVLFVVVGVVTAVVVFVDDVVVGVVLLIVVFIVVLEVVGGFVLKVVVCGDAIKFVMTWFNSIRKSNILCCFLKARIMDLLLGEWSL